MKLFHGFGNSHAAALDQHFGDVGGGVIGHGLEVNHKVGADFFKGAKTFFVISVPIQNIPGFVMKLPIALNLLFPDMSAIFRLP